MLCFICPDVPRNLYQPIKDKSVMRKYDWSKDRVAEAVAEANCWFDCLARFGIPKGGCNYRTLQSKVRQYGIDTSHFNYHYAKTHNGQHYGHSLIN
jgi:hypothetical protein